MRDYEDLQLRLIAREYEREGYSVSFEVAFSGVDTRFDAVARRVSDGDLVIIELVNAERSPASRASLQASLATLAEINPRARVDIRRIDPELPAWTQVLRARQRSKWHLRTAPSEDAGEPDSGEFQHAAGELLQLWAAHASLLQAFASTYVERQQEPTSLLATYNSLLAAGLLQAPEVVMDGIELDLFQLYDLAMAALQGSPIEPAEVEQLRGHVLSVRVQVVRMMGLG